MMNEDLLSLLESFIGAFQATISVLLTVGYGVVAARIGLLSEKTANDVSRMCVKIFLPALVITKVGSELHLDSALRYVGIVAWSTVYVLISIAYGEIFTRWLRLPSWTIAGCCFNNTTSLPLLLMQSLDATGILKNLVIGGESTSAAINRAKSYFLVCATVSSCLTFAVGPKLLHQHTDDSEPVKTNDAEDGAAHDPAHGPIVAEHSGHPLDHSESSSSVPSQDDSITEADERTSLLPSYLRKNVVSPVEREYHTLTQFFLKLYHKLPRPVQSFINFFESFLNAPVFGTIVAAIIGMTPALHRAFFRPSDTGGIFTAWLTSSVSNIGELFTALQLFVVGSKLSTAWDRIRAGEKTGAVPPASVFVTLLLRFVFWPAVSIPLIWLLATKTKLLSDDPMLWFALMLMPAGPPAMKLASLAELSGSESQKLAVAKFLMLAYAVTPVICFAVVGALKASEAAIEVRNP